ncbi:hypothetical protein B0H15DRAFT_822324 [Mycena belliarum]|uniref:Uncharacterized protein n=1 Tax=Mycena belliarum TaxID=1033014 RepID=A0AAD6XX61_9AGAR|nr:hypothetical protein B0H15DRAFT_822324 [Mycena belliae]
MLFMNYAISRRRSLRWPSTHDHANSLSRAVELALLQFLTEIEHPPAVRTLQRLGCFQPDVHLGLLFYNELHDIDFYWDSLTLLGRATAKHRFLLEYSDAIDFELPELEAILWEGGRSTHVVFPRPSPPTSQLLTLVSPEGRLRIYINPDGAHPTCYFHPLRTESITRATISWLETEFRKPLGSQSRLPQPAREALSLAVYRMIMIASDGGTIVHGTLENASLLGEVVVQDSRRPFWNSQVQFRHYLPLSSAKSYKWAWHNKTTAGIYHGIPGWTRFTLRRKNPYSNRAATVVVGDEGDNVDTWDVLLACLKNWVTLDPALRRFCLCASANTQVGFVTQVDFTTFVQRQLSPLPGFQAAETVYLFVEDVRVEADGHVAPCTRYWSLDRNGGTPMSAGLLTLYGVDPSDDWSVRRRVKSFDREHFAALDALRTQFGGLEDPPATWRDSRPTLRRTISATRLDKVDWRTDWMWEDHHRDMAKARNRWIKGRRRKRRGPPAEKLEVEVEKEPEVLEEGHDLVRRLHRSKTKSVGGGLSLVYSRIVY